MYVVNLVLIHRQYTYAPIRWSWAPVHRTQIVVIEVVLLRPRLPITTSNHDHLLHGMSTILGKFVCFHVSLCSFSLSRSHTHSLNSIEMMRVINIFIVITHFCPFAFSPSRWRLFIQLRFPNRFSIWFSLFRNSLFADWNSFTWWSNQEKIFIHQIQCLTKNLSKEKKNENWSQKHY